MITILVFLLVLSVLVLIHEFGHYCAARIFGVKAEEFGYGFPPRAIGMVKTEHGWKRVKGNDRREYKNTIWSFNWLPLGGFVRLKGEAGEDGDAHDSFAAKKPWKRLIIIAAGVAMNWLLTAVIFSIGFMVGVPAQIEDLPAGAFVKDKQVQIAEVMKNYPADKAGILPGDALIAIDGVPVPSTVVAKDALAAAASDLRPIPIEVDRKGTRIKTIVTPIFLEEIQRPGVGISLADIGVVQFPWYRAIVQGFRITWAYTVMIVVGLYGLIRDLFVQHRLTSQVSGPVGIAVMTHRITQQGLWNVIQFTAILSLNLCVINFFPIPALDGGRAVLIIAEWLRRKKINPTIEANMHRVGFALLMVLIVLVTISDVRQYGGMIVRGLKQIVGF